MNFSLADAAKKTGMSRSSMYRLVEEGKLSVTTDHRGKKVVDLSELLRVFGSVLNETPRKDKQENTRDNPVIKKAPAKKVVAKSKIKRTTRTT